MFRRRRVLRLRSVRELTSRGSKSRTVRPDAPLDLCTPVCDVPSFGFVAGAVERRPASSPPSRLVSACPDRAPRLVSERKL